MNEYFTGGRAVVETLLKNQINTVFCVPGESYLGILESMRHYQDKIRLIINRHESGASFGAAAYARITNKPGIALVSRGPGATNAAIGVHTAYQDSTPLVLLIGQVPTSQIGTEAFQEIDYKAMFKPLAKHVLQAASPDNTAETMARALELSVDGRPGPVVLVLPEDTTTGKVENIKIPRIKVREARIPPAVLVEQAAEAINLASHPLIIAGEMINFEYAHDELENFIRASGAGVCAAFRRQGVLSTESTACLGHLGLSMAPYQINMWADCDVIIAMGTRLDAATTMDFNLIRPEQTLIHIYPDNIVLKRNKDAIAINGDCKITLNQISNALTKPIAKNRLDWREKYRNEYKLWAKGDDKPSIGSVDMHRIIKILSNALPSDATVTNDAGNFATWLHRFMPYRHFQAQLGPAAGAMGYGVPAAIAAKIARPNKVVVGLVGDGGFMMTGQELITAVEQKLNIIVIVCDNSAYGTIAMHQVQRFGIEGQYGVKLKSPDFSAAAEAWGVKSWTINETKQFESSLHLALRHNGPSLMHIKTDIRDIAASGLKLDK